MSTATVSPGGELAIKRRKPSAVVGLTIVTLGIYGLVWYYKVNREMRDFGLSYGDLELGQSRPWRSVLAVTLGGLVVLPPFVSQVQTVGRLRTTERLAAGETRSGAIAIAAFAASIVLCFASAVHGLQYLVLGALASDCAAMAVIQARLNAAWDRCRPQG